MNRSPSLWRRLWFSLPLAYKLVIFGLSVVITATLAVLVVTYMSAGDSLKLQLERQVSRDLNVFEAWYRTRFEEMQLTSISLVRHDELHEAVATGRFADAAPLLTAEVRRLHVDFALLVDRHLRVVGLVAGGRDAPTPQTPMHFDPHGLLSTALSRNEPIIATEAWQPAIGTPWPADLDRSGLERVVATPVGTPPEGVLLLGERLGTNTPLPGQITAMIGGSLAILDDQRVLASSGFPQDKAPQFSNQTWAWVGQGRDFFEERRIGGKDFVLAFRPIVDHEDHPVGAVVRGFSESLIGETLSRYAGGISMLASATILGSLLAFFWLTRRLLFPLHRLAAISASLAAGDLVPVTPRMPANDELGRLEKGVASLADRLMQSREELAEAAVKLEVEAALLAERNAQLAELNHENARLLDVLRDHDRLRGQLIEKI
ncbi:MAG TPA: methyl-accepting chemotaxis protein, partial [Oscillatoriaceae cyanobacterium]